MGMGDFPDMYAQGLSYQANQEYTCELQVLCNTFIAVVTTPVG